MARTFSQKIRSFFKKSELPPIDENSSLIKIAELYPDFFDFIQKRYAINLSSEKKMQPLKAFVAEHSLPPPQVVFMELQMVSRSAGVGHLTAQEATELIDDKSSVSILDVREKWELQWGSIPKSVPLTEELLEEILETWEKDKPVLLYCHFGVRSLDAASFLADRGFTNIFVLKGGIDSWSTEIDPSIPRYEGAYC